MCRWLYTGTLSLTPYEFRCCWYMDVFTLVTSLHGLRSSLSTRAQPHGHGTSQPDSPCCVWLDCLVTVGLKAAGFMCWGGALRPGEASQALGGSSPLRRAVPCFSCPAPLPFRPLSEGCDRGRVSTTLPGSFPLPSKSPVSPTGTGCFCLLPTQGGGSRATGILGS